MLRRRYCLLVVMVFFCLLLSVKLELVSVAQGVVLGDSNDETRPSTGLRSDNGMAFLNGKNGAQQLEQSTDALYRYVLEGNVTKVRQMTDEISRTFVSSSFEGMTSVEGINALSEVIMDLKATVASAKISPQRWESSAAKLRLAVNSLNHPRQPIWLQYYKLIREDLNKMEQSGSTNDLTGWKTALERLQNRYDNIRPAVIISRQPEIVNAFDSWLSYAAGIPSSSQKIERTRLIEIVSYGQEAARVMFGKEKDEPALSLPMTSQEYGGWALLAAAFIISVLAYVAYRKYRGEKQSWKPI